MNSLDTHGLVRNAPDEVGIELGKEIARLADASEAEMLKRIPNAPVRCRSCAFRLGTYPNGCSATLMDIVKCIVEEEPFYRFFASRIADEGPHVTEPDEPSLFRIVPISKAHLADWACGLGAAIVVALTVLGIVFALGGG